MAEAPACSEFIERAESTCGEPAESIKHKNKEANLIKTEKENFIITFFTIVKKVIMKKANQSFTDAIS